LNEQTERIHGFKEALKCMGGFMKLSHLVQILIFSFILTQSVLADKAFAFRKNQPVQSQGMGSGSNAPKQRPRLFQRVKEAFKAPFKRRHEQQKAEYQKSIEMLKAQQQKLSNTPRLNQAGKTRLNKLEAYEDEYWTKIRENRISDRDYKRYWREHDERVALQRVQNNHSHERALRDEAQKEVENAPYRQSVLKRLTK
jgi:hypothetical protein